MSYTKILETLQSQTVNGPHVALGLRKPGENKGIWLLGESHENDNKVKGEVYLDTLLLQFKDDTVLLEEGLPPGKPIFMNAPEEIMSILGRLFPGETPPKYDDDATLEDVAEYDEDGNKFLYDTDFEMYADPEYWKVVSEFGYINFVAEKFRSVEGKTVNVENKIRHMFIELVHDFPNNGTRMHNISDVLKVISWALADSVHNTTEPKGGRVSPDDFKMPEAHEFYENLLRSVQERFQGGIYDDDFLLTIIPHVKALLTNDPRTAKPYMADASTLYGDVSYMMLFSSLFMNLMMDMNLPIKMNKHPNMNFVFYGGSAHCVNQYINLTQQGYELEHTFVNPALGHIGHRHRREKGWLTYNPQNSFLKERNRIEKLFDEADNEDEYKNYCTLRTL